MRLSRPCYDKMHRCPGWAGGGMRYAKTKHCYGGHLQGDIYRRLCWRFRFNRCDTCDVLVLPYMVRYLDWRWLKYRTGR